jgi:UDP:flavonoid glycosyltransferase YjiC (YdhE family)
MKFAFFNIPTSGHANPALALTAALVEAGHEVTTYLTPGYRDKVLATGSAFRAYDNHIRDDYFDEVSRRFNPPRLAAQLLGSSHRLLPGLQADLAEMRPDAVLYDSMCPWGRLVARAAGLPAIASMSLLDLGLPQVIKSGALGQMLRMLGRQTRRRVRLHGSADAAPPR